MRELELLISAIFVSLISGTKIFIALPLLISILKSVYISSVSPQGENIVKSYIHMQYGCILVPILLKYFAIANKNNIIY